MVLRSRFGVVERPRMTDLLVFGTDRMLRLTLLAPDIVETILRGEEPSGLSLARLVRRLPTSWTEQRKRLGILIR